MLRRVGAIDSYDPSQDVLRTSVLEYAPVAMNEIVSHFAPFVENSDNLRRLGRNAIDFVLACPPGVVPKALPPELGADIAQAAIKLAEVDPADARAVIHEAFAMGGEFGARRAGAADLDAGVVEHFVAVMVAFEGLVQDVVAQAAAGERDRLRALDGST